MGATVTEQRAEGRNASEAYRVALEEAASYYGTQDGYSGAINSKDRGFVLVALPPRVTYRKFTDLLLDYEDLVSEIEYQRDNARYGRTKAERSKATTALRRAEKKRDALEAKYTFTHDRGRYLSLGDLVAIHGDKWGVPLAVELRPSEAKPSRRGRRVYVFCGYAPC